MTRAAVADIVSELQAAGLLRGIAGELPEFVTGITEDSRAASAGDVFAAISGAHLDGHEFVAAAHERGAVLALVEQPGTWSVPSLIVDDARGAEALAAAVIYGRPADQLRLAAVTGTNGKTTTVSLARSVLDQTIGPAASIGTLGVVPAAGGVSLPEDAGLTTPGVVELQRIMRLLVDSRVEYVAMEVSSHSLAQRRVEGLSFEVAAFTTFTRDHLDYHGTMDQYFAAKASLVERLAPGGTLVVNSGDPAWNRLPDSRRVLTFGSDRTSDVRAENVCLDARGSEWTLRIAQQTAAVRLPLIGEFNVENALAAAGIAYAMGAATGDIAGALYNAGQVPGRLEVLSESPLVIRDYAHTPDALERALNAVRPLADGRVIVVFGCGGDRDKGKRPVMGEIAARHADRAIVTSDNPRTEDPELILDEIVAGMPEGSYDRVEDRREAIASALELAGSGDVVLIAGKGHETYQIRGATRFPFDEKEIVNELLVGHS